MDLVCVLLLLGSLSSLNSKRLPHYRTRSFPNRLFLKICYCQYSILILFLRRPTEQLFYHHLSSITYYIKIGVSLCRTTNNHESLIKKCFCRKLWSQLHPHNIAAFIVLLSTLQSVVVMAEPVKFSTIKPWFGPGKSFWALLCGPVRLTLLAILDGPVVVVVSMCTQTSSETLLKEGATGS